MLAGRLGCPTQAPARARPALVLEFEHAVAVYFAPAGSDNPQSGVAYILFVDGTAQRIDAGSELPLDRLGRRITQNLDTSRAIFQSYEHGRIFVIRGWRNEVAITVALTDGVNGAWR